MPSMGNEAGQSKPSQIARLSRWEAFFAANMLKHGISQNKLAEKLNCHPTLVKRYRTGQTKMSLKTAKLVADAFRCSVDDLAAIAVLED